MAAVDDAVENCLRKLGIRSLKPLQKQILECILNKKDCMAILPTGYGKSLPYQLFLPIKRIIDETCCEKIIVCCPLTSLMEDQVLRMAKFENISAAFKGKDPYTDQLIRDGKIDVIFSSPESLMTEEWIRQLSTVSLIVVDEFHTVVTWGGLEHEQEEKVFRKWFRCIGELRSIFPDANVLALSATCTKVIKERVLKILNLQSATMISESPNRQNIKFIVRRTSTDIGEIFIWLIDSLITMKNNFPRTVIYCNSIQDVSNLYFYLTTESEELKSMIEMYHSETPAEKKENIVQKLGKDSDLKIVIATSALGMGIDVKDCHSVILYGPPKEIVDLLQETGRCGRDGEKSVAVIMCNRYQLGHVSSEVKNVVKTTDCRRTAILQHFVNNNDFNVGDIHFCCDLCAEKCPCGACEVLELEKLMNQILNETDLTDDLSSSSDTVSYEYESDLDTGLF